MYKAVIFDVGGVLIDSPFEGMVEHYCSTLDMSEKDFYEAIDPHIDEYQKGTLSEVNLWNHIAPRRSDLSPTLWVDGFARAYSPRTDVFNMARDIRQAGYTTMILSNTETSVMDYMKRQKYEHFDHLLFSCDIGLIKPHPEIYNYALDTLKIKPAQAIFIDDKIVNVEGAVAVGMTGIHYTTYSEVRRLLQSLITF